MSVRPVSSPGQCREGVQGRTVAGHHDQEERPMPRYEFQAFVYTHPTSDPDIAYGRICASSPEEAERVAIQTIGRETPAMRIGGIEVGALLDDEQDVNHCIGCGWSRTAEEPAGPCDCHR